MEADPVPAALSPAEPQVARTADPDAIAAEPLAQMLYHDDEQVCREASGALVQIGSPASRFVAPILQSASLETRELAALVLRWVADDSAAEALTEALTDSSPYVRQQAARTLGRIEHPPAIAPLQALLNDPDTKIRQTAEISLKKMGVRFD
jgi:HEAT repeat protein